MKNKIMLGLWRYMLSVPPSLLAGRQAKGRARIAANLVFMTAEHRRVHHFVVRELPGKAGPLAPGVIASALNLEPEKVNGILKDLEEHMTFLFRNAAGRVVWAYPVTLEETPHHVTFDNGEQIYAA